MNALICAIRCDNKEIAKTILDRPNLPDTVLTAQNKYGANALLMAIIRGHTEIATAILARPNLPDTVLTEQDDLLDYCSLTWAIAEDNTEIANAILNRPNLPDTVLSETLMWAIYSDKIEIAIAILNRPNLPDTVLTAQNKYGQNALMIAIDGDHTEIAEKILNRPNLPDAVLTEALDLFNKTEVLEILENAIAQGNFDAAKIILEKQAIRMSTLDYSTLPISLQDTFRQHCSMVTRIQISIAAFFATIKNAFICIYAKIFSKQKYDPKSRFRSMSQNRAPPAPPATPLKTTPTQSSNKSKHSSRRPV
jgi:ankyrin repeat protein